MSRSSRPTRRLSPTREHPQPASAVEKGAGLRFEALAEASRILSSSLTSRELKREMMKLAARSMGGSPVTLFLLSEENERLEVDAVQGRGNPRRDLDGLAVGKGLPGWVAAKGRPVLLDRARRDSRFRSDPARRASSKIRSAVAVPVRRGRTLLGVLEATSTKREFDQGDRALLQALAQQLAVALASAGRIQEAEEKALRYDLLHQVTLRLGAALDLDASLKEILDSVRRLVDFDAAGVFVLEAGNRQIVEKHVRGYAAHQWDRVSLKVGEGVTGWAAKHGKSVVVPDVRKDSRYIKARQATKSQVAVPLMSGGRLIGVLNLESDRLEAYKEEDLELLQVFTNQAAVAIEVANYHRTQVEHQRLEHELGLARSIQKSLLPRRSPKIRGFQMTGYNRPSEEVGGDYYDFIRITRDHLGIAIADISGKGIPGALTMASLRAALRVEVTHFYSITDILGKVSDYLFESTGPEEFATIFYGVLDLKESVLTYGSAGHDPGILVRSSGELEYLESTGTVLGAFAGHACEEMRVSIEPGDFLVLYTDGITEAMDRSERQFGIDRLVSTVRRQAGQPARAVGKALHDAVRRFVGKARRSDDLTYIVVRREPGS